MTDNLPFEKQDVRDAVVSAISGQRVLPDGPVPCDLAVVGESPGKEEVRVGQGFVGASGRMLWANEKGGDDLVVELLGRARETVYVTNVCKVPLPDKEWAKLTKHQQACYYEEVRSELNAVAPKVVMAFGRRAATALCPGFRSITQSQGTPVWGYGEAYVVVPLWHPAYILRGNHEALADLIIGISQVSLLLEEGLPKPLAHGPSLPWQTTDECLEAWPESISFLTLGKRSKLKCQLCGSSEECGRYEGEGLKWTLCLGHAILTAQWAVDNEPALREHAKVEAVSKKLGSIRRAADRMEDKMRVKWSENEYYQAKDTLP